MADYYIRTPDRAESRGPFDAKQLQTLAEADQINPNTLYYDEAKGEWVPLALNESLTSEVFPKAKKLTLKMGRSKDTPSAASTPAAEVEAEAEEEEAESLNVEAMLAAAEADTEDTRYLKEQQQSFEKAVALANPGIGLMLLLSAVGLLIPHASVITTAFSKADYASLINHPLLLVGLFDCVMAGCLFLAVTEVYPLLRGRGMLGCGFGLYLGWALGDPLVMAACATAGVAIFYATIAQNYAVMLATLLLGIIGNGALAYLACMGHFSEFFERVHFNLLTVV